MAMRLILIAREGLPTIVLIENGNDEDAWKGDRDAFRIPQTWYLLEPFSLQTRHTLAIQEGCQLKAPLGTGLCALRPEENFF